MRGSDSEVWSQAYKLLHLAVGYCYILINCLLPHAVILKRTVCLSASYVSQCGGIKTRVNLRVFCHIRIEYLTRTDQDFINVQKHCDSLSLE